MLVIAGIFAATWLTTRFLAGRFPGGGGKQQRLQIIERLPLGKDRQVALLRVGHAHYLVGIAGQQISFSQPVNLDRPELTTILPGTEAPARASFTLHEVDHEDNSVHT